MLEGSLGLEATSVGLVFMYPSELVEKDHPLGTLSTREIGHCSLKWKGLQITQTCTVKPYCWKAFGLGRTIF